MKRTPTLTIWILSFIVMVIFCETLNCVFWMSFTSFAVMSIYIEKHSERLMRDAEAKVQRMREEMAARKEGIAYNEYQECISRAMGYGIGAYCGD